MMFNACFKIKFAVFGLLLLLLGGCATPNYQYNQTFSSSQFSQMTNWYHDKLGFQLAGENAYPDLAALAALLKQADRAFMNQDFAACQILLERAQRISSRDAGVYVRLSYLYWLQDQQQQALQTARRALAVVGQDAQSRTEIQRLMIAIQQN